jgi:hypothetical protein
MRDYLARDNLVRASVLGAVATVMALPRIVQAGDGVWLRVVGCMAGITLAAGAVTAWGTEGGLPGPVLGSRETARGLGLALLLALILSPVQRWVVQPALKEALGAAANAQWTRLQVPVTLRDWFALALWSAGFQTLFFVAAPTCLAARLTGRVWPAFVLTAALGWYVASSQLATYDVESGRGVLVAASALRSVLGSLLYARFGLIPTAVLSVGYGLHLLWDVLP